MRACIMSHGRYVCIHERRGGGGGGGGDLFYALGESGIHRRRQTERESERDGESEREGGTEMYVYNTIRTCRQQAAHTHTRMRICMRRWLCARKFLV